MQSRCRYTRINGARCTMPALNDHDLCFQHLQQKRRTQRQPRPSDPKAPGPLVNFVYMDDHTSILANLNAIADAFAYGLIDHHQLSALTRFIQVCLKTLHQKKEHSYNEKPDNRDHVLEVAYDEDGLALAIDPPPAPAPEPAQGVKRRRPRYSDLSFEDNVEISAGAAPEPPTRPAPEITATANPEPTSSAASSSQQPASFQTLTPQSKGKSPVFKHLPKSPKTDALFSNTCIPLEEDDPLQILSLPSYVRKLIEPAIR